MPEPASSRSLEDILASIRKSLADETVDGLVELSAAAVDAARAEQDHLKARAAELTAAPSDADRTDARSPADALADDLLRDKLAGALVLDHETGEEEAAARDEDAAQEGLTEQVDQAPDVDPAALAKLWVLRPGIDQVRPAAPASAQSLTLDPFASNAAASETRPVVDFSLSPLELMGEAKALNKPLPSMPPLPQLKVVPASAAEPVASAPPRLDPDSMALLQKLRASNAAAIENIAKSNEAADAEPDPASEPDAAEPVAQADEHDDGSANDAEAKAVEAEPAAIAPPLAVVAGEALDARSLLSRPERSTPLFGAQPDARPQVTSGIDQLLPEPSVATLAVDAAEAKAAVETAAEAEAHPEPTASAGLHAEPPVEPLLEDIVAPEPTEPVAEAASEAAPQVAGVPGSPKALEDMIAAVLEPVLQRLIETSIGPALEDLVRREVERVMKEQRARD